MNPFELRTIVEAKHAQHVVLVHFPIGLFISGVAFDLLSRGKRDSQFATAAYVNICFAAMSLFPVAATGLLAWQFAREGKRLHGLLLGHVLAALVAGLLILVSWWAHRRARRSEPPLPSRYRIFVELAGVAAIAVAAHLGGFLSGVNL